MKVIYILLIAGFLPFSANSYWIEDFEGETKATLAAIGWEYFPTNGYSMTSMGGFSGQYIRANAGIGNLESLATPCMVPVGPLDTIRFHYTFFAGVSGYINVGYQDGSLPAGTNITWIGTAPIVYSWVYKKFPYVVPSYPFRIVISFNTLDASCKIGLDNFISYQTEFYGDCANLALPVQLSYFNAEPIPSGISGIEEAINVSWKTESELNSLRFEVMRSLDGIDYETIAEVNAAGNSNEPINYSKMDADAPPFDLYYRLRMVDAVGYAEYSPTVFVERNLTDHFVFSNGILTYLSEVPGRLIVSDLGGRPQLSQAMATDDMVSLIELPPGFYIVTLSGIAHTSWKVMLP